MGNNASFTLAFAKTWENCFMCLIRADRSKHSLYWIRFLVLSSKYGKKEDILRKKKNSLSQFLSTICFSRHEDTLPTNQKLFIIDYFTEGRYEPIWSFNNPDKTATWKSQICIFNHWNKRKKTVGHSLHASPERS